MVVAFTGFEMMLGRGRGLVLVLCDTLFGMVVVRGKEVGIGGWVCD